MINETLKNALSAAAAAVPNKEDCHDPLMERIQLPPERTEMAYQNLFMSLAYFLKFKVKAAKENELKKYGVYVKSNDQFMFGAYISVIDNDGEDSITLDYTFDEDNFKDLIDNGYAICTDDPSFAAYSTAATSKVPGANGESISFYILPQYLHTVYVLAIETLKSYIEGLLDDPSAEKTVTVDNLFTATGYIDNGIKRISIEKDELLKQIIKSDDENEVAA